MKENIKFENKIVKGIILLYFILMFIFPSASFQGARKGLLLWFVSVVPTLLPFIIVSNLLIQLNITRQISKVLHPILGRLLKISPHGCYPVLIGFLSGIPMGAKSTADLISDNKISDEEGTFLYTMCNNSSPIFIMSFVAISQLKLPQVKYALFAIVYSSSIISSLIYRAVTKKYITRKDADAKHMEYNKPILHAMEKPISFRYNIIDGCIMNGFEVITKIGGYIILFSILAQIINGIIQGSGLIKGSIIGILEITTGISQVCKTKADIHMKIVLATVLTSFGGLSGMAQTKSVLGNTRLSLKTYFKVKLINIIVTFIITLLYITFIF